MDNVKKLLLVVLSILACSNLQAENRVAVKARASEEYLKARALDESKKIQTYQVLKGRFHEGTTADPTLDRITFEEIVYDIALQLRKQGYYPLREPGDSDLLIVVHYGRTDAPEDMEELLGYTSMEDQGFNNTVANAGADGIMSQAEMNATADFGFNMAASETFAAGNRMTGFKKALMLGMEEVYNLDADITMREERLLQHLLLEERYYIVLVAYDFPKLQAGEVDPLWVTRYSIRSIGQSFGDAVTALNTVAGDYFGKNFKDLVQKRVSDSSRVEIGEIEVISHEDVKRAISK
ncbi:MAG: hypothetical protein O7C75_18575 [Verrucomicrobia bacterium]|nr:hypothetical protein [Verrucomicrobiota bacterium]